MSELTRTEDQQIEELISQLADDYLNLLAEGEDPPIDYWVQKHPQAEDVIRRTIGALRTMRLLDQDDAIWAGPEQHRNGPPRTIGDFRLMQLTTSPTGAGRR